MTKLAAENSTTYQPVRAPRGTALTCKSWQQEAALRMLMNNLDPEVAERPQELIIYGGLLYHFLTVGDRLGGMLVFGAAAGSVLVSYVKARAEGLGYQAKVGLLTRAERYLVLAPSLVFGLLYIGLGIIAIFANITALQRIWYVRKHAYERIKSGK